MIRVTMLSPSLPYRLRAARAALECAKKITPFTKLILAGHSNGARVAATLATVGLALFTTLFCSQNTSN